MARASDSEATAVSEEIRLATRNADSEPTLGSRTAAKIVSTFAPILLTNRPYATEKFPRPIQIAK